MQIYRTHSIYPSTILTIFNMNETFIERLDQYMRYAGLNDNKVTVQCGLSVGTIGKARKKNSAMGSDNIERILNTYKDLNARWLLTGEGEMVCNMQNQESGDFVSYLKEQNRELIEKVSELSRQIGELNAILDSLKKGSAPVDTLADCVDAEKLSVAK